MMQSGTGKKRPPPVPAHVKYRTRTTKSFQEEETKMRPSEVISTLTHGGLAQSHNETPPQGPQIVEFLDLQNTTTQTNSSVEVDKPIFQPYPHLLKFPQYEPFGVYEQTLFFRNNDSVSRRIRVLPPDSPYFEVIGPRSPVKMSELEHSKIGPGMEVCFIVKFRPQEVKDYKVNLVCVTEREKFLVPVHALGLQPVLNMPDAVDFNTCPVKSRNVKTILTQNVGTAMAKFTLSCTKPMFEASPVEGIVEVGQTTMIEVAFTPQNSERCEGDLVVSYEDGEQVFISLSGISENVDVFLSTPSLALEATYISLSSQRTVKVQNRSEIPVKFSWKQFAHVVEEESERQRLYADLTTMQELEEDALERDFEMKAEIGGDDVAGVVAGSGEGDEMNAVALNNNSDRNLVKAVSVGVGEESDEDLSGDEAGVPAKVRVARAALSRKYRHLRRALEEDSMGFADNNFEIKPMTGEIWANSEIEVTVTFRPDTAAEYATSVFLDVIGRDERLPLWLTGVGIGPKGVLSYDVLDIGDVFVNSEHHYELGIANKGDIPAHWRLLNSNTPFGSSFEFHPSSGQLAVGASETLGIGFSSGILGEFSETFKVQLKGSDDKLSCQVKGHVIGPTFAFDVDVVDFGIVSYAFSHSKTIVLTNTSEIAMSFSLSIPQDGAFISKREFTVEPTEGNLAPGEQQIVTLTLIPMTVKTYDYFLTVDVDGVGQGLLSMPLLADCRVPDVQIKGKELDFGECFNRFPYELSLSLVNTSNELCAKFAVVPQEQSTKAVAEFYAEPSEGSIPAGEEGTVTIRLVCVKLGQFRLPLSVTVAGSVLPPMQATITATVTGPRVVIEPSEIVNWGNTDCLLDAPRQLTLTNESDIPAPFKAFVKNARSKYRLDIREGVLAPRESSSLTITANLDDTIVHKDSLHLIITEGDNLVLPLVAKGIGTTMFCHEDLSIIDFGSKFTSFMFERKVTLENKGRRSQTLTWTNQTLVEAQAVATAAEKKRLAEEAQAKKNGKAASESSSKKGKKGNKKGGNEEIDPSMITPTFTVFPAEVELRPRTAVTFTFRGYSMKSGYINENLICEAKVGKEKNSKVVFKTVVQAEFTNPLLEVGTAPGGLDFSYTWSQDEETKLLNYNKSLCPEQILELTNKTSLPLVFSLKASQPFHLDKLDWSLDAGEIAQVSVGFDPSYRNDRQSQRIESKIQVSYPEHPQRDTIGIVGEINFPNLSFDNSIVNFGSVLNDTTKTMVVRVKNTSKVEAEFSWSFVEDAEAARLAATTRRPYIPVNQVYDILPIRSKLAPGEEEDVEFIYYGHAHRKFKGGCLCEVEGGPEYELTLIGEASTVGFKLDRSLLNFGKVLYSRREDREFHIINPTKVAFSYRIHVLKQDGDRQGIVEVHPSHGKVSPNDKNRVVVKFRAGLPERVMVNLCVECAHFEAVILPVYGEGIYPSVAVSLPRDESRQLTITAPILDPGSAIEPNGGSAGGDVGNELLEASSEGPMAITPSSPLAVVASSSSPPSPPPLPDNVLITPFGRATSWMETLEIAKQKLRSNNNDDSLLPPSDDMIPPAPSAVSQTFGNNSEAETQRTGRSTGRTGRSGFLSRRDSLGTNRSMSSSRTAKSAVGGSGKEDKGKKIVKVDVDVAAEAEANRLILVDYLSGKYKGREMPPPPPPPPPPDQLVEPNSAGSGPQSQWPSEMGSGDQTVQPPRLSGLGGVGLVPKLQLSMTKAASLTDGGNENDRAGSRVNSTGNKGAKDSSKVASIQKVGKGNDRRKPRGEPAEWVVAWHACDFGNVVSGVTRKRVFRVTNTSSSGALSWVFDKHILDETGFALEPEKVVRLPEGESVQFTITFNAKKSIALGPKEVLLPLDLKHGPSTVVVLKANVTVPEVSLSVDRLHFGDVWVGCSRTIYVQIHNISPVRAEWDFKRAIGNTKDENKFSVLPRSGSLAPGERCEVAVEYIPNEDKHHFLKLPLKVSQSSKSRTLALEGAGVAARVTFKPSLVELGPILPYSKTGDYREVTLTNSSDRPIEVYSLDFDENYLEEEEQLRYMPGYGSDDLLRLPIRMPGDTMPQYVLDEYRKGLAMEEAVSVSVHGSVDGGGSVASFDMIGGGDDLISPTPRWDKDPTPRSLGKHHDTIVIGPPRSGVSTLAKALAEAYGYRLTTVDAMIEEVAMLSAPLGRKVRASLGRWSETDIEEAENSVAALKLVVDGETAAWRATIEHLDTKSKKKAEEEHTHAELSAAAEELKTLEEQIAVASEDVPPNIHGVRSVEKDLLTEVVGCRVNRTDCGRGIVIDSLSSIYLPQPAEVAEALANALPQALLTSVKFKTRSNYAKRLAMLFDSAQKELDEMYHNATIPREVLLPSKDWIALLDSEAEALAQEQAAKEQLAQEAAAALAEKHARRANGGTPGRKSVASTDSRKGANSAEKTASVAVARPPSRGGHDEFSGPFVELGGFDLGMLDDDAKVRYHAARRRHLREKVEAARDAQQKVCALWSPSALKLLPRSGLTHGAKNGTGEGEEDQTDGAPPVAAAATPTPASTKATKGKDAKDKKDAKGGKDKSNDKSKNAVAKKEAASKEVLALDEGSQSEKESADEGGEAKTLFWQYHDALPSVLNCFEIDNVDDNASVGSSHSSNKKIEDPLLSTDLIRKVTFPTRFDQHEKDTIKELLKLLPVSKLPLPSLDDVQAPKTKQLIKRPAPRPPRDPQQNFFIVGPQPGGSAHSATMAAAASTLAVNTPAESDEVVAPDNLEVADKEGGGGDESGSVQAHSRSASRTPSATEDHIEEGITSVVGMESNTRWVLPPHESVTFTVKFTANATGKFHGALGFEVLGLQGRETQLLCTGICEVPQINDDPRNVFMSRIKSRPEIAPPIPKKFIMNRGLYEFGPLLIWKPLTAMIKPSNIPNNFNFHSAKELALISDEQLKSEIVLYNTTKHTNAETFRISNNGKFETQVKFEFEISSSNFENIAKRSPTDVFYVEPNEATLKEGETLDVTVWSFPSSAIPFKDTLIVCVSENPIPTLFPVSCIGVQPALSLHGPWESNMLDTDDAHAAPATPAPSKSKKDAKDANAYTGPTPLIDFDRLLTGKAEDTEFTLKNDSFVPIKWKMDISGAKNMPEFEFGLTEGDLAVGESATIHIGFAANEERVFDFTLPICFTDCEANENWDLHTSEEHNHNRVFKKAIHIKAESYQIKTVAFEGADGQPLGNGSIDFGSLRVGDSNTEKITLRNKGKYQVEYSFNVRKPHLRELFNLEPAHGVIAPGEICEILATFCSKYEVMLRDNKDIRCTISEPHTGQPFETFNILASARSYWSRFKLQPGRGLAFGAVKFNEVPRTRLFQIKNEGQFAFVFGCKDGGIEAKEDPGCDSAVRSATPLGLLDASELGPDGQPPVVPPEVIPKSIDRFTLTPSGGLVEPGQTLQVEVAFNPKGSPASHKAVISVLVSGSDPSDSATINALKFDIVGETCHPGILTNDFRSVFEEQDVIPSLAEALANKTSGDDIMMRPCYCEEEVLFTYGSVVCSSHPKGVVERFKISNPHKIPCSVKFTLEPVVSAVATKENTKGSNSGSGSGGANDLAAFSLATDSDVVEIGPHEHFYVPVHFKPTEMRSYRCNFKAVVSDGSSNPQTATISYDLTGKGTMPCVTVEAPLARSTKGEVLVDFGRVHVGRSKQKSVTVANDGKVVSTALFEKIVPVPIKSENDILGDLGEHTDKLFLFNASGTSITLESDQRKTFFAHFTPPQELIGGSESLAVGNEVVSTVRMTVMHNPFESTIFRLVAVVYANDVLMEDLPDQIASASPAVSASGGGSENVLNFGEYDMEHEDGPKLVTFTLRNRSDAFLRYEWGAEAAPFSVSPRAGHLSPGQTIEAVAMFSSTEAASCTAVPVPLTTQRIKLAQVPESNKDLWTASVKVTRPATKAEITAAEKDKGPLTKKVFTVDGVPSVEDEAPEPEKEVLGEPSEQTLECSAVADTVRYECETKVVPFSPTAMFQVRTTTFEVKNPSGMSLPYRWKLEDAVKPGSAVALSRMTTPSGGTMSNLVLPCPFTIEPGEGTIPALSSTTFTVRFAPSEVEEFVYYLDAQMPTLANSLEALRVLLRGKSIRPVAHFDLADNPDYITSRAFGIRNEMGVIGPIEASSCRCAELTSRGTGVRNTKRFCVHNPTSVPYDFTWEATGVPDPAWRCMTPKGTILSGRKGEMIFEYTPEAVGHAEAFFKFNIPSHGIDELFLFSGTVVEPEVLFDRMKVDFNALMVGTVAVERIHVENREPLPFSFHFDKSSMGGADASGGSGGQNGQSQRRPVLDISPMSGLVPPNGRIPIDVTFCPTEEKFSNFNLVAVVRRKPLALGLNVKGEGYAIHARLSCSDSNSQKSSSTTAESTSDGSVENSSASSLVAGGSDNSSDTIELLPMPTVNYIDFGSMNLGESRSKKVVVSNMGRFNFDYLWTRNSKASSLGPMLEIRGGQLGGTVRKGASAELGWVFRPVNSVVNLDGCEFTCTVAGKYDYVVKLRGQGLKPALHFSFHKWNFGPCFVTPPGAPPVEETAILNVVNHDPAATLSLDCTFENTRTLSVECPPRVMEPGHSVDIPIRFTPRDIANFECPIPFLVNGSTKINVTFSGYGIPARLELANPTHSICGFGVVSEGEEQTKTVKLVNRSKRPIEFELFDNQYMGRGTLEAKSVTYYPTTPTILEPREGIDLEIRYFPKKRMPSFSEDLMVRYAGNEKVLLTISGSSSGMNVGFEQDTLPFGTVCTGSLLTKPLVLENGGDLVATYRWLPQTFGPHFSLSPLEGRVGPGAAATFMVTFKPNTEDDDIRAEGMKLLVDGCPPLTLNCLGACVPQPSDSIMDLNFNGRVRRSTMQQLVLKNPTAKPWYLTPVLVGDHWRCSKEVLVPANGTAKFDVTFFPLCMTETDDAGAGGGNGELEGSLFFALPSGSALLYRLKGTSTKPDAEGVAKVTTPAKRILPITLPLRNWLDIPQRFNVNIEMDAGTNSSATSFEGTQTVDLPAHGGFEYVVKCKAFKEGPCGARVTFTNPKTGEYLFHDVKVNVTPPGIMETIKLESHVRQVSHHLITIENPLPSNAEITFPPGDTWWTCDNPCIRLFRVGEMAGNKEGTFQIEYRPLRISSAASASASETETILEFNIAELGSYKYALSLTALPHAADPILRFEAPLGGSQTETFTFRAFHRIAQSFTCKVGRPAFFEVINASPTIPGCADWEGQEVKVQIRFEPEKLGAIDDVLVVTQSGGGGDPSGGGDYRVRLAGVCLRPQPQGPFEVAPGGSKDIPIRNVFAVDREYNFTVDNPAFVVSNTKATIKAKDGSNCTVKYTPTPGRGGGETAKLLVSCPAAPDMPPLVFYLRGKT